MSSFIERRKPISQTAITLAVMFGLGVLVALVFGGVPTWQKHGPDAGPGFVRRANDPGMYYSLTLVYAGTAAASSFFAFFRFPWVTITHIRLLFLTGFLLLLAPLLYNLAADKSHDRAQAAWARIESLGGHGVWDNDMVVVSLKGTEISDDDLSLFSDFPHVQILDISCNPLTDGALKHLDGLGSLETLILYDTQITDAAIAAFSSANRNVKVQSRPLPPSTINPFTGKPTGE
jgi:hypothetical protein